MNRDEATEDRLDAGPLEPRLADHRLEPLHAREAADRFDQVAIAVLVAGDRLADPRDEVFRIKLVRLAEARPFAGRELEAVEPPAALQHASRLAKRGRDVGHIPDSERD